MPIRKLILLLNETSAGKAALDAALDTARIWNAHLTVLHVRVDADIKAQASENLANFGLTLSDAVRIVLTRVAKEGALPAGLMTAPETYDAWFRAKVHEALDDPTQAIAHDQVMQDAKALINKKRRARA